MTFVHCVAWDMVTTTDSRVDLQPAYVLHQRAYRDTSAIIELFSRDYGRVSIVAKGIKGQKKKSVAGAFQPFSLISVSWQGLSDLKTFTGVEQKVVPRYFSGDKLVSALYLNEILLRTLPRYDAYEFLFELYSEVLTSLDEHQDYEHLLRYFERRLVEELGYDLNLTVDSTGEPVAPDQYYFFLPDQGPVKTSFQLTGQRESFKGSSLIQFAENDFSSDQTLRDAKKITRIALKPLLGERPLKSRELFIALHRNRRRE